MKILTVIFLMALSLSASDELDRVNSMVDDISKLQIDYQACQKELADANQTNNALKTEMGSMEELNARNREPFEKEIETLKKDLDSSKKLLAKKDKEIQSLNSKINNIETPDSQFPKLIMKDEYSNKDSNITYFKAMTFRLKDDSYIYDDANGKKIEIWSKNTSFTSYMKKDGWVKITGYFIDKRWVSAKDREMWVKKSSIKKH